MNIKLATLALAGFSLIAAGSASARAMTVSSNGGLKVYSSADNQYWFKLGGYLHLDEVIYGGDGIARYGHPNGSNIRRARLSTKGGLGNDWAYKMDLDFNEQSGGGASFGETFIAYNGCQNWWVALGQISVPFSLDNWTSSSETTFMERSAPAMAFAPDDGLGIYVETHGNWFTLAAAAFHPKSGKRENRVGAGYPTVNPHPTAMYTRAASDPFGAAGRLTFSPVHTHETTYHAGVSAYYQNTVLGSANNNVNFSTNTEVFSRGANNAWGTDATPYTLNVLKSAGTTFYLPSQSSALSTSIPSGTTSDFNVFAFEAAGQWGPFLLSGEYFHASVNRGTYNSTVATDGGQDLKYKGYYVAGSYVLTGERKEYDFISGTFGRVHPQSKKGAWEIAARHSWVDLADADFDVVNGGSGGMHSTTLGVTWWVNDNLRFLANYVRANLPLGVDLDIFGIRAAANWG